jgi:hypothetical protein
MPEDEGPRISVGGDVGTVDRSRKWYFKMFPENMDDKDLAIVSLTIIAIVCVISWKFDSAVTVISNIVTAIAGIVTGRALTRGGGGGNDE